jgi:uracil-DNA glycosylase family 4
MFVRTVGPLDAKIMLVGESPGKEEDLTGEPFANMREFGAGRTLNQVLNQAGISRAECLIANVARERPPGNKISFYFEDKNCTIPKPKLKEWIELLRKEITLYNPNIVVALGSTALWALTGEKKISELRGYFIPCTLVPGKKVLATYHPQHINNEWKTFYPTVMDMRKAARHSSFPEVPVDDRIIIAGTSPDAFIQYMREIIEDKSCKRIALDIETNAKCPGSHITILGIAKSSKVGMSIQVVNGQFATMNEETETEFWRVLSILVNEKEVAIHNAPFDKGVLWFNNHILVSKIWMDTLVGAHVLWPELPRDLGFVASLCLEVPPWKGVARHDSLYYNACDAINTYGIAEIEEAELIKARAKNTYDFESNSIDLSLLMQLRGMDCDITVKEELKKETEEKVTTLKEELDKAVGKDVNYNSPQQLQQLLYIDLGFPVQYKRRKSVNDPKVVTVDANALAKLSIELAGNTLFNKILEYKKAFKLVSSFIDIPLSPSNTVHTSFNITGSATDEDGDDVIKTNSKRRSFGRWSSSTSIIVPYGSGNLQNIPKAIRRMYVAPPGYNIIQADGVQAEAVVVAHLIGDYKLIDMFNKSFGLPKSQRRPYDIHILTAMEMFGLSADKITDKHRDVGKTIRHASNYGMGPAILAVKLKIKQTAAKQLIDIYHQKNPLLRLWYQRVQQDLQQGRVLYNLLGRPHKFLDWWGDELFRSAYSYIPQSTVGDLLNKALQNIYYNITWITVWSQLHDALYVLCPIGMEQITMEEMRRQMIIPLTLRNETFYIDVDFSIGKNWKEMKEQDIDWREFDKINFGFGGE